MIIAVTGATSMIGSALVRYAIDNGHEVIAIIRNSNKNERLPESDKLKIIYSDISEYHDLRTDCRCDMFFHLAWKGTSASERDDVSVQYDNIGYALESLKLAIRMGAHCFVGAGSQAEYGVTSEELKSTTPTNPESGYGIAKYASGKLCSLYCKQNNIKFNWGRIVSAYGEYDSEKTLTMYLIKALLNKETPDLTKCEQIWNYTYAYDVAKALFYIGTYGKDGKTYCLGNGDNRPLKDYVESLKNCIDENAKINYGAKEYYPHQPMILCPDITELKNDTGYTPDYDYETGIKRVIEFVKNQKI